MINDNKDNAFNELNKYTKHRVESIDVVPALKKVIDESVTNTTYICTAPCGTSLDSPYWQIMKVVVNSGITTIIWADGNSNYDNIATNRTSLTYR